MAVATRNRDWLFIINSTREKSEQYFYNLLLLLKPWRKIDDYKGSPANTDALKAEQDSLTMPCSTIISAQL